MTRGEWIMLLLLTAFVAIIAAALLLQPEPAPRDPYAPMHDTW